VDGLKPQACRRRAAAVYRTPAMGRQAKSAEHRVGRTRRGGAKSAESASKRTGLALSGEKKGSTIRLEPAIWEMPA
jgi:hypothetical protein